MKLYIYTIITILVLAFVGFGQTKIDQPTYSSVFDIKDFKKVYVAAKATESRNRMIKVLKKQKDLSIVGDPKAADFTIEYIELSRSGGDGAGDMYQERGEMQAYYFKDEKKIIVWADTETYRKASGVSMEKANEQVLISKFLKIFQRNKNLK